MSRLVARIALGLVSLLVVALTISLSWEVYIRYQLAREYPPLGKMIDIGGRRMQLDCRGEGSPTVEATRPVGSSAPGIETGAGAPACNGTQAGGSLAGNDSALASSTGSRAVSSAVAGAETRRNNEPSARPALSRRYRDIA